MIKGIGVDTVQISRMQESLKNEHFLYTVFTEKEIENQHGDKATYYATRFAAKEAFFKANGSPSNWLQVETLNDAEGKPYIVNEPNAFISITTEAGLATAFCVIEK